MKVPKYQLVQNDLRQQIISGKFENGDKFYTESELTKIFNVSSITVIRAVNELVKDGYLIRQQGKGTFVSRSRKGKLVEFSDIEIFPLETETVAVISCEKGNDPQILEKLELDKSDFYYKIVRVRTAGDTPYIYQQSHIPARYIQQPNADLQHFQSLYQRFKLDFNIHMSEEPFVEINEIVPVPAFAADHLKLTAGEPAVFQTKVTQKNGSNEVLEYVETYKHWKYFKIEIAANKR
ncbi:GntR family transcriptional regulator [Streptococcus suis]|uniref:GntR family transcriptional regulator n=1 Tax=Streptococcus suis TaxID=1307 RepID=A0A4T2GNW4_STRSU|nr:GntR family transcriptional regulator [Streptococcus suis]MBM7269694.1 GntR family transcriptional regulator [Streptococcus suis]TII00450.1 GntR family transcriptional regulator [Streptococcus suis]HEL2058336.1 GntR family transcriptional regulator [Streptococcus suis]